MLPHQDLLDYDEDDDAAVNTAASAEGGDKKSHSAVHTSGFRDFLLKPELMKAITDCGFEHLSQVQHECIPQAILGTDVLCQAKSAVLRR